MMPESEAQRLHRVKSIFAAWRGTKTVLTRAPCQLFAGLNLARVSLRSVKTFRPLFPFVVAPLHGVAKDSETPRRRSSNTSPLVVCTQFLAIISRHK